MLIPNYNGAKFIIKTINTILNGFSNVLIIVIDDVSTDNSIEIINNLNTNRVKLIEKEINGGFASSVNVGLKYCKDNNIEFTIVSNSDIILSEQNAENIYEEFVKFKDSSIAVLGFLEDGVDDIRENENISGFFFILRLSTVSSIGYLDETFYMYGEEQDFFRRIIQFGYKIEQTNIQIKHLVEKSSGSNVFNSWLSIRNSIYLEVKNNNIWLVLKKIIVLFLIINKIYQPKVKNDPSLQRIYRPGILKGNIYLIKAILWNIKQKSQLL